jgi:hypothetical protein
MSMEYRTLARLFHADRSMDSYANHDRLVRQRLEADSTFTTGIGTPLGELFIATPRCVCMLTQKVLLAERRVSAMWRSIPGVMRWNYIYHAISEELLATNEMEGVRSTRKETEAAVAAARQARTEGDMEKARFGEFAKLYLNLTNRDVELPKTLEDIRDIYDKIALDEIDDKNRPDGELFRKGDVEVQGPHGTVIHSGVSSEARISALLAQMMDLARSDTIPFLPATSCSNTSTRSTTATAGQAGICSRSTSATISLCPPCCPSPGRSRRTRTNTTRRSLRPRTNSTAGNSRSSYTPSSDSSNGRRNP